MRDEQFVEIYANLSSVLNQQSTFISLAIPNRLCLPRSLYSRYVCPSDDSSRHLGFIGRKTQFLTEFFFICAHMEFWVFVLAKVSPLFPYISKNYCVFIQHSFQLLIFRTLDLQIQIIIWCTHSKVVRKPVFSWKLELFWFWFQSNRVNGGVSILRSHFTLAPKLCHKMKKALILSLHCWKVREYRKINQCGSSNRNN